MFQSAGVRVAMSVVLGIAGSVVYGQNVISARSGLVHYVEGDVFIGDKALEGKTTLYDDVVKEGEVLRTEEGRAEVLLTPGVFLRLAENSSFKMWSSRLSDTRVEPLSGTVLLEAGELLKDNSITLIYKNDKIEVAKNGLYRIDVESGSFRVYNGQAIVTRGDQTFTVKQAKVVSLNDTVLMASNFDNKVGDEFYRWASRRANYLSIANMASAKQAHDSGLSLAGSQWVYNPWYNMFTYLPYRGSYMSPFGYGFWSPMQIGNVYPGYGYGGYYGGSGYGYGGGGGGGAVNNTRYDASSVGARPVDMGSAGRSGSSSGSSVGSTGGSAGGNTGGGGVSAGGGGARGGAAGSARGH